MNWKRGGGTIMNWLKERWKSGYELKEIIYFENELHNERVSVVWERNKFNKIFEINGTTVWIENECVCFMREK